ncbi:ABC transporter ATP-binding protein [Fodinibius sp.]|uniref:ABC transporter ATP-binding protein n=1 Tax=Fodinibius sp. TaxID=1872440 RepID=UPI002ACDB280|nr:ABC transporter ATP-binding protein [Fodinibius sp.]MDZ7658954.1 ABC transporter ATP-binding protein [Fodinibius sp.]
MILQAENISKTFKKSGSNSFHLNIDHLEIKEGSFTAILGPNGSGKSTFLKIILDLLFADSGNISLMGNNHEDKQARAKVSYLPENYSFPEYFTVKQMLHAFADLKESTPGQIDRKINELANAFNVNYLNKRIKNLSKGMRQTSALMHTFLADDQFYILDEPFNGLDAVQKKAIMDYIFRLQQERNISILITTHILSDIDKTCDTLYLINDGRIINSASKKEIQKQFGSVEDYYLNHFETKDPAIS